MAHVIALWKSRANRNVALVGLAIDHVTALWKSRANRNKVSVLSLDRLVEPRGIEPLTLGFLPRRIKPDCGQQGFARWRQLPFEGQ